MLLRISCLILGYSYGVVKNQTPRSRQKITNLAMLLLIPVFLWGLTGFLLAHNLLGVSMEIALITGLTMSVIIFSIDRSVVTATSKDNGRAIRWFRVAFALVSAVLGSIALDLVIFNNDIDEYRIKRSAEVKERAVEEFKQKQNAELEWLKEELAVSKQKEREAKEEYNCEVNGTCGTGQAGLEDAAKIKKAAWDEARAEQDAAQLALIEFKKNTDTEAVKFAEQVAHKASNTLLSRFQDFHEFVFANAYSMFGYFMFLFILLCLELFVLVYKTGAAKTAFDKAQEELEDLEFREMRRRQELRSRLNQQEDLYGPNFKKKLEVLSNQYPKVRKVA